jgi:hypothetical protein
MEGKKMAGKVTKKAQNKAQKYEFRLTNLSKTLHDEIGSMKKQTGCANNKEFFDKAVEALKEKINNKGSADFNFNETPLDDYDGLSEKELVQKAQSNMTIEVLAQKAVLSEAKRLHRANSPTTMQGTARQRATNAEVQQQIHELVQSRMTLNEQAKDWTEQRYINTSWVQKGGNEDDYGRSLSENLFNFKSVKQYLDSHKDDIEQHHRTLGIMKNHNMRVPKELKRREKQVLVADNKKEVADA